MIPHRSTISLTVISFRGRSSSRAVNVSLMARRVKLAFLLSDARLYYNTDGEKFKNGILDVFRRSDCRRYGIKKAAAPVQQENLSFAAGFSEKDWKKAEYSDKIKSNVIIRRKNYGSFQQQ